MCEGVSMRQLYNKGIEEAGTTFNLFDGMTLEIDIDGIKTETAFNEGDVKYISEYRRNPKLYDMFFLDNYGEIAYSFIRSISDISIEDYRMRVSAWQLMNKYKLNKLYDASLLIYKPLDNYAENTERTIEGNITEVQNGKEITGNTYGKKTTRTGTEVNTLERGTSQTESGAIVHEKTGTETSTRNGLVGTVTLKEVNPSDDDTFVGTDRETVTGNNGTEENKLAFSNRSDVDRYDDRVTTYGGKDTAKTTYESVQDADSGSDTTTKNVENMENVRTWNGYKETETAHGCSRGDTSQHLLTEERAVADWSFWEEMYLDFLKNLTTNVYMERGC